MKRIKIALIVAGAVIVAAFTSGSTVAVAQLQIQTSAEISFSAAETAIIVRNAQLSKAVERDPAIVRRVLDEFAKMDMGMMTKRTTLSSPEAKSAFDRQTNPDLSRLERASPEALHDLFQLLKQAAARKPNDRK